MLTTSPQSFDIPSLSPNQSLAPAPSELLDAAAIWASLRSGRERIRNSFCTKGECHLELERGAEPALASQQCWATLILVLQGESQKFIALDTRCAASTVALQVKRAMESIGLYSSTRELPAALVNVAQVAFGALPRLVGRSEPVPGKPHCRLLSIRRPDPRRLGVLSPAEIEVVDLLVEGKNRREVAEWRGTSGRTIANQLAQVYKKLHLTGRIPLLIRTMQSNAHSSVDQTMLTSWLRARPA